MACNKQNPVVDESNKWNGYEKYLKMGEQVLYHLLLGLWKIGV